ncbi:hypothetical protein [Streptomyces flavofungini]|uniref:Uncharacterized protein n=1 Tax=Streptomyces flavofungini TaxID=68200 RepID=A0ABS0X9P3_9ACTN|nr:hypothetical protein [Streptomyces flavofungini]MBJ3809689.1 hypothetical protein [Streptomyces flavofungini]GHC80108.1 hypothetical protein GCM10010349_62360 [Streptomyces flavofungini]
MAAAADGFEIRIKGRVGASLREAFSELAISVHPAETVLRGSPLDQAALYGILDRIQSLGLELVEVRRLPGRGGPVLDGGTEGS